ncbi:hypothetical protein GGR56DRAFT_184602 [Xylariaceae sp. FL0804]|nr:hypothetical protein GGR56DRAFT_184602 [Xylariaceae sp. FL0804]
MMQLLGVFRSCACMVSSLTHPFTVQAQARSPAPIRVQSMVNSGAGKGCVQLPGLSVCMGEPFPEGEPALTD